MARGKGTKTSNYAVGFKRPPKSTQFKKGESGNKNGRPKGSRSVGAILDGILQQKIAVTEHGKTRRLPALEVMLRRLANDAMRSEPTALKLMLSLNDRYGQSAETAVRHDDLLAEDRDILAKFLNQAGDSDVAATTPQKRNNDDD